MTIRIIIRNFGHDVSLRLRRPFVYPHRSIRSIPFRRSQLFLALATAGLLTVLVVAYRIELLSAHDAICSSLLQMAGIPVLSTRLVSIYEDLASVPATHVAAFPLEKAPFRFTLALAATVLALLAIHRRITLASGFVIFLLILLLAAAGVMLWSPHDQFGALEFTQIWLRVEFLVWLLLPLFTAGMFILIQPSAAAAIGWSVGVQAFGFLWSAARLAFCLGVLHFTGFLFVPLMWFVFGLLADTLYLMVAYSALAHRVAEESWGLRKSWQF